MPKVHHVAALVALAGCSDPTPGRPDADSGSTTDATSDVRDDRSLDAAPDAENDAAPSCATGCRACFHCVANVCVPREAGDIDPGCGPASCELLYLRVDDHYCTNPLPLGDRDRVCVAGGECGPTCNLPGGEASSCPRESCRRLIDGTCMGTTPGFCEDMPSAELPVTRASGEGNVCRAPSIRDDDGELAVLAEGTSEPAIRDGEGYSACIDIPFDGLRWVNEIELEAETNANAGCLERMTSSTQIAHLQVYIRARVDDDTWISAAGPVALEGPFDGSIPIGRPAAAISICKVDDAGADVLIDYVQVIEC